MFGLGLFVLCIRVLEPGWEVGLWPLAGYTSSFCTNYECHTHVCLLEIMHQDFNRDNCSVIHFHNIVSYPMFAY